MKANENKPIDTRFTRHLITVADEPAAKTGACHVYKVFDETGKKLIATINFQKGPLNSADSIDGLFNEDLALILLHRLEGFQAGEFACLENVDQINALEKYICSNYMRRLRREFEGVNGTWGKRKTETRFDICDPINRN